MGPSYRFLKPVKKTNDYFPAPAFPEKAASCIFCCCYYGNTYQHHSPLMGWLPRQAGSPLPPP